MTTGGTRRSRASVSVTDMGSGVFNGAFTTFLGFVPLAWANFGTGVIFAQLFTFIIALGILHGFFALPMMLAQWGPDPVVDREESNHSVVGVHASHEMQDMGGHAAVQPSMEVRLARSLVCTGCTHTLQPIHDQSSTLHSAVHIVM